MVDKENSVPLNEPDSGQEPEDVRSDFLRFWRSLRKFFYNLVELESGLDREGTVVYIKNHKRMNGANAWLLMCSIMIASLGLDMSSPAIIIGAMLISPLMSPILGVGLGVATNDREALFISLRHFGIAIAIAIITSYLYFLLNPLGHESPTPEMLSRTEPTLLDGLVAIFGGAAGIISSSRKDKTSAIPGVAIATALMPPLCVAGYGIARMELTIFLNSFYLFFLNSFFVALATYVVILYLRFPSRRFVNAREKMRTTLIISVFSLIVIIPSAGILYKIYEENVMNRHIKAFVENEFGGNADPQCIDYELASSDSVNTLIVKLLGRTLTKEEIKGYTRRLSDFGVDNTVLYPIQDSDIELEQIKRLEKEISGFEEIARQMELANETRRESDFTVERLQGRIDSLISDTIAIHAITKETLIAFDRLQGIRFGKVQSIQNGRRVDVPTFLVRWRTGTARSMIEAEEEKLASFLKVRAGLDTISIVRY